MMFMATDGPPRLTGQYMMFIATDRPSWLTRFPEVPTIETTATENTSGGRACVMGILVAA